MRHCRVPGVPGTPTVAALVFAGALLGMSLGACGSGSSTSSPTAAPAATTFPTFIPVGLKPSTSAKMVCDAEGQEAITAAVGKRTKQPPVSKWIDHLYSCRYVYAEGAIALSVKELSTAAQTTQYFDKLKRDLGWRQNASLGDAAFVTKDGAVVVRKDYKVLLVDPKGLPEKFGQPLSARDSVATSVAIALMSCWTGA